MQIISVDLTIASGKWLLSTASMGQDVNGVLIDGQHRLYAVIEANYTYQLGYYTGLPEGSLEVTDTNNKERSLSDMLGWNDFKKPVELAGAIRKTFRVDHAFVINKKPVVKPSNAEGLVIANKHSKRLYEYDLLSARVADKGNEVKPNGKAGKNKVFSKGAVLESLHIISRGQMPLPIHQEFLENMVGITVIKNTACARYLKYATNLKIEGYSVPPYLHYGFTIKAWNLFINNNPEIQHLKFNPFDHLPKVDIPTN